MVLYIWYFITRITTRLYEARIIIINLLQLIEAILKRTRLFFYSNPSKIILQSVKKKKEKSRIDIT